MKLPGWCRRCRRFRQVNVDQPGMLMLQVTRVADGVCDECVDAGEREMDCA